MEWHKTRLEAESNRILIKGLQEKLKEVMDKMRECGNSDIDGLTMIQSYTPLSDDSPSVVQVVDVEGEISCITAEEETAVARFEQMTTVLSLLGELYQRICGHAHGHAPASAEVSSPCDGEEIPLISWTENELIRLEEGITSRKQLIETIEKHRIPNVESAIGMIEKFCLKVTTLPNLSGKSPSEDFGDLQIKQSLEEVSLVSKCLS